MSKHGIIVGAIVITLAYIGGVLWLHYGWAADATLGAYIDGKKLNSVGDFLAGVFSPLAFLWLIATVLIQSNELGLQREELTENRRVMEEQAVAAKAQAKFLGNQIEAMERQNNLANQVAIADHKFRLFDKRMAVYDIMMKSGFSVFTEGEVSAETHNQITRAQQMSKWFFDDKVAGWMSEIYVVSRDALLGERKIAREIKVMEERKHRWTDERETALNVLREKTNALTEKVEAMLEPVEIDKVLGEFLRIPPNIEPYEKVIDAAEQQGNNGAA